MTAAKTSPPKTVTWQRYPDDALEILENARITRCRQAGCGAPIWWGETKAGRRCPFDVTDQGTRTGTSHWRTCTDRPSRSK